MVLTRPYTIAAGGFGATVIGCVNGSVDLKIRAIELSTTQSLYEVAHTCSGVVDTAILKNVAAEHER